MMATAYSCVDIWLVPLGLHLARVTNNFTTLNKIYLPVIRNRFAVYSLLLVPKYTTCCAAEYTMKLCIHAYIAAMSEVCVFFVFVGVIRSSKIVLLR